MLGGAVYGAPLALETSRRADDHEGLQGCSALGAKGAAAVTASSEAPMVRILDAIIGA